MAKMGRPTKYTDALGKHICNLVATHPYGLRKLCEKFPELPTAETIRVWRWEKDNFSASYVKAKQLQSEIMAESFEDVIANLEQYYHKTEDGVTRIDSGMVSVARLIIDSRKWTAAKLSPKIYGERQHVEQTTTVKHEDLIKDLA